MAKKVYVVRLWRESGEMVELPLLSADEDLAKHDAEKSFNRKFNWVTEEDGNITLEEIRDE